ncbi:MAG: hypothetical protein R3C03_00225 [Pirellulaceae bacterium]
MSMVVTFFLAVCSGILAIRAQEHQEAPQAIETKEAKVCFALVKQLANEENGNLWGISLDGPLIFVDPSTRFAVANRQDAENVLVEADGVFTGTMPSDVPIANTSCEWSGTNWSMVLWPLPEDPCEKAVLLMHESWHRIQDDLNLESVDATNSHLDSRDGRYWIQLEWRALASAIKSTDVDRIDAIADAIQFRLYRQSLFENAKHNEIQLELHEGLAEFTGFALSGMRKNEQRQLMLAHLEQYPKMLNTYVRSFAYLSGPALGLLIQEFKPGWTKELRPGDDLGQLLADAAGVDSTLESADAIRKRAGKYNGDELWNSELTREEERQRKIEFFKETFVDGPVLTLPLGNHRMSFNPSNIVPLEEIGTVYPTLSVAAPWGELNAEQGALIRNDFSSVLLEVTNTDKTPPVSGKGWTLKLNDGWELVPGDRDGDWLIKKQ